MAEAILEQSDCLIDRVKEAVLPLDREVKVVKKDGTTEEYCIEKIVVAVNKSAKRVLVNLTEQNFIDICNFVTNKINEMGTGSITMLEIHSIVECALQQIDPQVALSYRNYRNYKQDFVGMLDKVYQESQRIMYLGDKENSNIDSTLVATKRSLTYNELSKELYKKFFLNKAELQACNDGYIYIHDMSARLNCMNCCLFNISEVLNGGFEMGNIWYNEPKSLDVAFDVIGDIVMSASSQQYGGFTLPEIDTVLVKYAERSYKNYYDEAVELLKDEHDLYDKNKADEYALKKVQKDFEQGFQGWEYKFNTVGSSRGDYPFITVTSGLETNRFGVMCNKAMFKVRMNGQGKKGNKKPVLFPKIVFLYDKDLHGEGGILREVYDAGIACSQKAMYPDWLSLTGEGYIASMYKKYKKVISPMGCRAFLSPWYERGGMTPADENDIPVFTGRFNIGAVSLHLPMIFMKAKEEGKDFYTVLDYYLEMIRGLHLRTYDYLGEMRASINPLAFCEGGFYGGHLDYHAKIKPILESATASFGITALNELQRLYNGKSIYEDGKFTLEVMEHINKKVNEFKQLDGRLYAIYGTPAESLCFAGNTLVSTVSGHLPISEIKVGDLVYSYNEETKTIELKPVVAAKQTQEHAVVVKVTTDNGQKFICTPDHPFAVRRVQDLAKGNRMVSEFLEYIPACELKPGMRLKSKHTHVDRNNRVYFNSSAIKNYRHRINATYKFGSVEGYEVHHIDEDRTNDSLDNLQLLTPAEHRRQHGNLVSYQYTSESMMGELNPFYGKKHTKESKELNRKAHIKGSVERYSLDMKHLQHFECLDDVTKYGFTRHLAKLACCGERQVDQGSHYYKDSYWFYTKDCKELLEENHKVVSVEYLDKLIPVYNLTVEGNHNYYVGGEHAVLVHNCEKQVYQFRDKYGIIKDVSDRLYVSNSFHCHVTEDITPIEKQNSEKRFWELLNGGKIQYAKYPISYNKEAVETLVDRAMEMGFYEGVNLELSYCDDCGHEELNMDVCPKCGSRNLTKISRMNGYLSYSRVKGDTRLNKGKMEEIKSRVSM